MNSNKNTSADFETALTLEVPPVFVGIMQSFLTQIVSLKHGVKNGLMAFTNTELGAPYKAFVDLPAAEAKALQEVATIHLNNFMPTVALAYMDYIKEAGLIVPDCNLIETQLSNIIHA